MINKDLFEFDDQDENFENELDFSEENIKNNISNFSKIKLADIVVANRYIGIYQNIAIDAMQELAKRRAAGDNFEYEIYIENSLKELPVLDFNISSFSSLINRFKK